MDGLPAIDAATLDRMSESDLRELLALADRDQAIRAADDFATYCARTMPGFLATPAHLELCAKAQAVADGRIQNLAVAWPVRHGKTQLLGRRFVLWWMGRNPGRDVMFGTHTTDLANKTGNALRKLAQDPAHLSVFRDAELDTATARQDEWMLKTGGTFKAVGQGAACVGWGWHLGICDDLLRGLEAANSALQREAVWDWYCSDFLSRMQNPNCQIFTSARWHDADPFGRIEEQEKERTAAGVSPWHFYTRAALGPNDDALAPDLIPLAQLLETRRTTSTRIFQALWQGSPVADAGDIYRRDWFVPSDRRLTPANGQDGTVVYYAVADIATKDGAGDWTVLIVFGVDTAGLIHIVHVWRAQASSATWVDELIRLSARWRPQLWAFGAGALFNMARALIKERMTAAKTWVRLETFPEAKDKVARSQGFAGLMENDRVRWDQTADWYAQAESELLRFPAGRTDDVVDACSLIGMMASGLVGGTEIAPPPPPKPLMIIGDYTDADMPDGFKPPSWDELVGPSMARQRRLRRRPYH